MPHFPAAATGATGEATGVLVTLFAVIVAAKLFAELFERLRQPAVAGEILAGVVVGPSVLGLVTPNEITNVLAEMGVIFLLFNVGLETKPAALLRVGKTATVVAVLGVIAPFVCGWLLMRAWGAHGRRGAVPRHGDGRHFGRHHGARALRDGQARHGDGAHHPRRGGDRRHPRPHHPRRRLGHGGRHARPRRDRHDRRARRRLHALRRLRRRARGHARRAARRGAALQPLALRSSASSCVWASRRRPATSGWRRSSAPSSPGWRSPRRARATRLCTGRRTA